MDKQIENKPIDPRVILEILQQRATSNEVLALHIEAAILQAVTRTQADTIRKLAETGDDELAKPLPAKKTTKSPKKK